MTKSIDGREYRVLGPYVGTIQHDKKGIVYLPYKEWLEVSRGGALGTLSAIALAMFPDAGIRWRRAFPVKDGEELQGHDLWGQGGHFRFYPHFVAPDAVRDAFDLNNNQKGKES